VTDYKAIKAMLLSRRYLAKTIPSENDVGVYAFFLTNPSALDGITIDQSDLLYLGMTKSSLDVRNHFTHQHSGFSTFRRSLGAILKQKLHLQAIRRAPGPSPTNTSHYRFLDADEVRLTRWMTDHLAYSSALVKKNEIKVVESRLIKDMQPLLNLVGWPNPQRGYLRALRKVCCDEARRGT
jgi:hypothetical protein